MSMLGNNLRLSAIEDLFPNGACDGRRADYNTEAEKATKLEIKLRTVYNYTRLSLL